MLIPLKVLFQTCFVRVLVREYIHFRVAEDPPPGKGVKGGGVGGEPMRRLEGQWFKRGVENTACPVYKLY